MSSAFRDKYLNKKSEEDILTPSDVIGALKSLSEIMAGEHMPPPNGRIKSEIMQRMMVIAQNNPSQAGPLMNGCVNTIAAIFGDEVAKHAAEAIGTLVSEIIEPHGMYLEHREGTFNLGTGELHGELTTKAVYGNPGTPDLPNSSAWTKASMGAISEDLSELLAKTATKKMTMN